MKAIVIALALCAAVFAAAPAPSPSFSTRYVTKVTGNRNQTFTGTLYEDYTAQRQRDDTTYGPNNIPVTIISFHQHENRTVYVEVPGHNQCQAHRADGPLPNRWEWLNQANSTGSCTVGQTTGAQWTFKRSEATVVGCFSGNIPLQITLNVHTTTEVTTFSNFVNSAPSPDTFQLDASCFNH